MGLHLPALWLQHTQAFAADSYLHKRRTIGQEIIMPHTADQGGGGKKVRSAHIFSEDAAPLFPENLRQSLPIAVCM